MYPDVPVHLGSKQGSPKGDRRAVQGTGGFSEGGREGGRSPLPNPVGVDSGAGAEAVWASLPGMPCSQSHTTCCWAGAAVGTTAGAAGCRQGNRFERLPLARPKATSPPQWGAFEGFIRHGGWRWKTRQVQGRWMGRKLRIQHCRQGVDAWDVVWRGAGACASAATPPPPANQPPQNDKPERGGGKRLGSMCIAAHDCLGLAATGGCAGAGAAAAAAGLGWA